MKHLLSLAAAFGLTLGAAAQTTFNVDMTCAPEGFENVFVSGPWCGWCANDTYNVLTDDDGDGIYTVVIEALPDTVEYTYGINGFAGQENLINDMVDGADCAPITDYATYANRVTPEGSTTSDIYGTCDGTCNDDNVVSDNFDVTFQMDASGYEGPVTSAEIFGTFNGWEPFANAMEDADGDGIWETTISLSAGSQEFKFRLNQSVDEAFDGNEACTTDPGQYVNRVIEVTANVVLPVVCWDSCEACPGNAVPGCTDEAACNYDENATEDDDSCVYGESPTAAFSVEDAACFDGMGMIVLDSLTVGLEGVTYSVDTMEIVYGALSLSPGAYLLTSVDSVGCVSDTAFEILSPEELIVEVTVLSVDSGAGDGQAEATVTGGTPEYTVVWTNMTGMEVNPDSLSSGLYTAVVTDANNCTASESFTMTVDGIADVAVLEGALFPVPVNDQLNVRLAVPLTAEALVEVRDVQGRLVASAQLRQNEQLLVLDAASWTAGVYTLQLSTEEARASWSFVK
ncbi:MAG: T9SS type A sorting domain-containing protein [Bacteroidetes bacterium]|nr:T9SS type A sorting domain-containing protein [Bacteroidota bacterium]